MRKLNKRERDFYNNSPNRAKVYYRFEGVLQIGYWWLFGGDCTDMFCDFEEFKYQVAQITYYHEKL